MTSLMQDESACDCDTISQAELAVYSAMLAQQLRYHNLRKRLLYKLESGAAIENGPLWAELEVEHRKQISRGKLEALLGKRTVKEFLRQIETTPYRHIRIQPVQNDDFTLMTEHSSRE